MRRLAYACLLGALAVTLTGCDNVLEDDDETFHVRGINLIGDAGTVQFKLDETVVATVDYAQGSGFTAAAPGSYQVSLATSRPPSLSGDDDSDDDDDSIPVGEPSSQFFQDDVDYTLIAYGSLQDPAVITLEGSGERDEAPDGKIIWRIVHAAPGIPAVDVYVTAPEAGIPSSQLVRTLTPAGSTEPMELTISDDDDESIGMTIALRNRDTGELLYTSPKTTVAERERVLFVIVDNEGPGPSAARLVRFSRTGASTLLIGDGEQASLRFVHASTDTPALDVLIAPTLTDRLAENVAFRGSSDYRNVRPGEVNLIGVPAGNVGVFVFLEEFNALAGLHYTAYAVGPLAELDAIVVGDDRRGVGTQARFRFLHAAWNAAPDETLDIYLTRRGEPLEFGEGDDDDPAPRFAGVAYRAVTDYAALEQGEYDAYLTVSGEETILAGPVPIDLVHGSVQTLVLTHSEDGGIELIPVEDSRL